MAGIKSLSAIREKWNRVTPLRTTDYKLGIENPKRDWADETEAAETNYKMGVDAAHAKGLFVKGVREAGSLFVPHGGMSRTEFNMRYRSKDYDELAPGFYRIRGP
ncbi:hypothetical protein ES705_17399 [subsurface metagenome]